MHALHSFEDFERFIAEFTNYERAPRFVGGPDAFRLERVLGLARDVGSPHEALSVVHIAGTKGKGSTSLILEALLIEAELRVGTYTSPHVDHLRERIRVDGASLSETRWVETANALLPALERRRRNRRLSDVLRVDDGHGSSRVPRRGHGRRDPRGRHGRPPRRDEHRARALDGDHIDRTRAHAGPRLDDRGDRRREGGHHQEPGSGGHRARCPRPRDASCESAPRNRALRSWRSIPSTVRAIRRPDSEWLDGALELPGREGELSGARDSRTGAPHEPRDRPGPVRARARGPGSRRGESETRRVATAGNRRTTEAAKPRHPARRSPPGDRTPRACAVHSLDSSSPGRVELIGGPPALVIDGAHTVESFLALESSLEEMGFPHPRWRGLRARERQGRRTRSRRSSGVSRPTVR